MFLSQIFKFKYSLQEPTEKGGGICQKKIKILLGGREEGHFPSSLQCIIKQHYVSGKYAPSAIAGSSTCHSTSAVNRGGRGVENE